jgi:hypothetical protein
MKIKKFLKNEKAVAGAIEFLLIIAFFAVILSYVQVKHIPTVLEDKEATHMELVSNQFSRLKALVNIQSQQNSTTPLNSVLTLGSREIPYWFTSPSYGEINVIIQEKTNNNISITTESGNINYKLTYIKYNAYNTEFVDQTYAFQGGGIILKQQGENSVMMVDPDLNATFDQETNTILFYFEIPVFYNKNIDDNAVGFQQCYIKTNYSSKLSDNDWNKIDDFSYLNISTNYQNAWYNFLDITFNKMIRDNITISKTNYGVSLSKKTSSDVELDIFHKKSSIFVKIE